MVSAFSSEIVSDSLRKGEVPFSWSSRQASSLLM